MTYRVDRSALPPGSAKRTPAGYLRTDARLTRVGVFEYRQPDGKVFREFRPPDEVFAAESLDTLRMVPLTDEHPSEHVDSSNARKVARGSVGDDVRQDGEFVASTVMLYDQDLIAKAESGEACELSCGYHAEIDPTPGVYNGQPYDAVQRRIVYDHVAVVPRGRAGSQVRLRMDAASMVLEGDNEGVPVEKIKIGDKEFEVAPDVKSAFDGEMTSTASRIKALEDEVAALKAAPKTDSKTVDELQGKLDALKAENEKIKGETDAKIATRVKLEVTANKILGDEKFDGLSDREIKTKVIAKVYPKLEVKKDASDAHVDGSYSAAVAAYAEKNPDLEEARRNLPNGKPKTDGKSAHDRMVEAQQNAWKAKGQ